LTSLDAVKLARFWAEVLERPVDDGAAGEFAAIGLQDQPDPVVQPRAFIVQAAGLRVPGPRASYLQNMIPTS
jgi:hypothetical protein